MSEKILEEFKGIEEINADKILSELFNPNKVDFHTEITNPIAITGLEILADWLKEFKSTSKILEAFVRKFKINMVPYDRKRAKEIVEAYKARKEAERERPLSEILLGR